MFKLDLDKAEEPEIKLPASAGSYSKNEMGIPDKLTCLLRNLYDSQEATVRTQYGMTE